MIRLHRSSTDEQHNLFIQIHGQKTFLLLHPRYFRCMYPFPQGHPADRQSQVSVPAHEFEGYCRVHDRPCAAVRDEGTTPQVIDVRNPDLVRFPRFGEAEFEVVTLHPGDVKNRNSCCCTWLSVCVIPYMGPQLLYIPCFYWHQVETLSEPSMSLSSWFKCSTCPDWLPAFAHSPHVSRVCSM